MEKEAGQQEVELPAAEEKSDEMNEVITKLQSEASGKNVLVLCANGATSSMLANAIKKGANIKGVAIDSTAMAYGQHKDVIGEFDLIVLAPQMASMLGELQKDVEGLKTKAVSTSGAEYVSLARAPEEAVNFVFENLKD